MVLWLAVGFPDGMIVLDEPNAGYMTDPMRWPVSPIRTKMLLINAQRELNGEDPVKLAGDKIFRGDAVLFAMFSELQGALPPWMELINSIISPLRVSIEWSYGKVKYLFKSLSLKMAQRLLAGRPCDDFILATFITNCRSCYQWDGPFKKTFGVEPPSIYDYLDQDEMN